jgi:hypothetical protein
MKHSRKRTALSVVAPRGRKGDSWPKNGSFGQVTTLV